MHKADLDIVTLISSRICHDLISPIGAVNNGLELLSMTGVGSGPEMTLIGDSVGSASARIRFFRIAFGAAGDQMVGRAEIASILETLYGDARWRVDWTPLMPLPRVDVRLLFLGILCLETGMPYGGQITVTRTDTKWILTGQASRLGVDADLWGMLATPLDCANIAPQTGAMLKPAHVQFALMPALARDCGRQITTVATQTDIKLSF